MIRSRLESVWNYPRPPRLVEAQPGDFYGGWITPDIVGPFKGGPGTRGW
jgi:hypothetical protein